MIHLKTAKELEKMREGGIVSKKVLEAVIGAAREGVTLSKLDKLAEELIISYGAEPSFKKVKGYRWSICACVNDVVVHGIPSDYFLKNGDVLGIDTGVYLGGFHTDCAWTIQVGDGVDNLEVKKFLATGKKALISALSMVKPDNYIYDISNVIQQTIEKANYSVVRSLVGHGVGRKLHEEPEIPGFASGEREKTVKIRPGMVFAIEVIYNMGKPEVIYKGNDGWTIATKDGKISGLFEVTAVVTADGFFVLTPICSLGNKLKEDKG
jgi:methionyl aminopeptidase